MPRSHTGGDELEKLGILKEEDKVKQLKLNHLFFNLSWKSPKVPKFSF